MIEMDLVGCAFSKFMHEPQKACNGSHAYQDGGPACQYLPARIGSIGRGVRVHETHIAGNLCLPSCLVRNIAANMTAAAAAEPHRMPYEHTPAHTHQTNFTEVPSF